jgi:hypothetical protein
MLAKTNNCLREAAKQGTKKHEGAKPYITAKICHQRKGNKLRCNIKHPI